MCLLVSVGGMFEGGSIIRLILLVVSVVFIVWFIVCRLLLCSSCCNIMLWIEY